MKMIFEGSSDLRYILISFYVVMLSMTYSRNLVPISSNSNYMSSLKSNSVSEEVGGL